MFKQIDNLKDNMNMYYTELSDADKDKLVGTGIFKFIDKIEPFILFLNNSIVDKLDAINLNNADLTFENGSNEREKTYSFLKDQINYIIHNLTHRD